MIPANTTHSRKVNVNVGYQVCVAKGYNWFPDDEGLGQLSFEEVCHYRIESYQLISMWLTFGLYVKFNQYIKINYIPK